MPNAHHARGSFPYLTLVVSVVAAAAYVLGSWVEPGAAPATAENTLRIIALGGRSTPLVADAGESWRLLSCHFVHTSWTHLVFNLAVLCAVGTALERATRRIDYAALLLVSAIASSVASLLGTPQVSAGSSGIVFGVLAAAVTFGLRDHGRPNVGRYLGAWVLPVLLILFVLGMRNPGVDHASHLGGLCAGLVGGMMLPSALADPRWEARRIWPIRLIVAGILCVLSVAVAPSLAGNTERQVALDDGVMLEVPSRWCSRVGPGGEQEFSTAGGMVVLTANPIPYEHAEHAKQWYERNRLPAPLGANSVQETSHTHEGGADVVVYDFERDGVPMARYVHFVRGRHTVTAVAFETPIRWQRKYDETWHAVVGSMRRSNPPTTLLAAAAQ